MHPSINRFEEEVIERLSRSYYDELLYFTETTEVKIDGKEKKYQYKVEIMDKNKVERVENPIKID